MLNYLEKTGEGAYSFNCFLKRNTLQGFAVNGGRDSRDWLQAGRSGDRIPVRARFFAHIQTGPGAHPAFCTMGTGSFPGIKRPGRGTDHPPLQRRG
jgi:hypothetical protein